MGGSCSCLCIGSKFAVTTSLAPQYNKPHIVAETMEDHNSKRAIEEEIERSKTHWSLLSEFELDADEVVEVSNVEVFRALQSHLEWGGFFQTFGKDGISGLVMGEKFAEGGQAELYDAHIQWNDPMRQEFDLDRGMKWALKVFKKGTGCDNCSSNGHLDCCETMWRGWNGKLTGQVFSGLLKYCRHARIIVLVPSSDCLQKNRMPIVMGCCVMRS